MAYFWRQETLDAVCIGSSCGLLNFCYTMGVVGFVVAFALVFLCVLFYYRSLYKNEAEKNDWLEVSNEKLRFALKEKTQLYDAELMFGYSTWELELQYTINFGEPKDSVYVIARDSKRKHRIVRIKEFKYDRDDDDDKEFATREAQELIEYLQSEW